MKNEHPSIEAPVTFLYTKDLDSTVSFYTETLGLELAYDQKYCRFYYAGPAGFIGICFAGPNRYVEPKGVVFTFLTPDVDGWYTYLTSRGVTPEGPPHQGGSTYAFFIRDPNGYLLEFQKFTDPSWPGPKLSTHNN